MSEGWKEWVKNRFTCIDAAWLQVPKRLLSKGAIVCSIRSSTPALLLWGLLSSTNNIRYSSGPCHYQQRFPWVDSALDQCSVISSPFAPAYFISGRFSLQIGCKIETQWKPSMWLKLAIDPLTERVKADLKVKIKVGHL